jgi:cytochrome d ubiquinol oxidase subunit I
MLDKNGNEVVALSAEQKIAKGKLAIAALADYKKASDQGNDDLKAYHKKILDENFEYFGYGYLNNPSSIIPNVPITFYSFRIMVGLGVLFILFFATILHYLHRDSLGNKKWLLRTSVLMIPLAYIASQAGWIVAELGRQPWVIQDILPTVAAVSRIDARAVQVTFVLFAIIFTTLLIAELKIMFRQIKLGPKDGGI